MKEKTSSQISQSTFQRLRRYNFIMGGLHFFQSLLIAFLSNDFSTPITRAFLEEDPVTERLELGSTEVTDVRIGLLVASFLFLSALAHFLIATVFYRSYQEQLKKGLNLYRWLEYSISSSVMIVAIALLTGIYDISALIMLFFLNAAMIAFGYVMEVQNQTTEKTDWSSFIFGSIAGIIPWVAIGIYLFGAGGEDGSGPPTFVYAIYFSLFVAFNCFAINMILQYQKVGRWRDYLFGEFMYILLSLVAKSALAWQVFAGTLRPE